MRHSEIFQRSNRCDSSGAGKRVTARERLMHSEMADKFRIRFATRHDAEVISWHRARMFQDMGELSANLFEAFRGSSCDQLRDLLVRGHYVGWLLSLENAPYKIIAGAGVHLRRVLPHPVKNAAAFADGRHGVIVNVFTEPEWRRKGLAGMLLKQIIDWSRDEKLDRLLLHVSANGRALYERLGFVATNEMRFAGDPQPRT
jgi:GNAT superfamily N-acetyltransferase